MWCKMCGHLHAGVIHVSLRECPSVFVNVRQSSERATKTTRGTGNQIRNTRPYGRYNVMAQYLFVIDGPVHWNLGE